MTLNGCQAHALYYTNYGIAAYHLLNNLLFTLEVLCHQRYSEYESAWWWMQLLNQKTAPSRAWQQETYVKNVIVGICQWRIIISNYHVSIFYLVIWQSTEQNIKRYLCYHRKKKNSNIVHNKQYKNYTLLLHYDTYIRSNTNNSQRIIRHTTASLV